MTHQKAFKLLIIGFTCYFTLACNRANDSTTKISISLPAASLSAKSETITAAATGGDTKYNDWSVALPQSVSSFNCYVVMVSGPEDLLKRNSCGKRIAANSDAYTPSIYFGPIKGAVYAGNDLEIDVASGANRVITLVGLVASSQAACVDYINDIDKTKLSKPYILGQSAPINLVGDTVSVPVSMKLDSNAWFEECSGPEFNQKDSGSSGTPIATKVQLRKDLFPKDLTVESTCSAFQVELKDDKDNNAVSTSDSIIGIKQNNLLTKTYSSYLDCVGTTNFAYTFSIQAGQQAAQRWLKTADSSSHPYYSYSLDLSATNLAADNTGSAPMLIYNNLAAYLKLHLTGPTVALADQCYRYDLAIRQIGANEYLGGYVTGDNRSVTATLTNGAFYSDGSCTSMLSNTSYNYTMDNSASAPMPIYVKFFSQPSLARLQNTFTVNYSGVGPDKLLTTVYSTATNLLNVPVKAIVQGDLVLPKKSYKCYGPYRLALLNAFNIEVPATAATTYAVTNNISSASIATSCNAATVSSLQIPPGSSFVNFYINASTTPLSNGTVSLTPTGGVPTALIPAFKINQLSFYFN